MKKSDVRVYFVDEWVIAYRDADPNPKDPTEVCTVERTVLTGKCAEAMRQVHALITPERKPLGILYLTNEEYATIIKEMT